MKEWKKRRKKRKHLLFGVVNKMNHIFIADVKRELGMPIGFRQ